jgi:hypothetical protein
MDILQDWIEQLGSVAISSATAILFLIASIAGWYAANWIKWLRR